MASTKPGGFTILELVVLIAVLIGSAALVVPVVCSEVRRADRGRAEEQCRRIAVALEHYRRDRAGESTTFPRDPVSGQPLAWLRGPGLLPASNPFAGLGPPGRLAQVLRDRDPGARAWKGPYLEAVEPDPWGHAYLVNLRGLTHPREHTWILSAGPNGMVETAPESTEARGDDIGRILP